MGLRRPGKNGSATAYRWRSHMQPLSYYYYNVL